ncbi:MAG TPA: lipopolysaccharide biosynthesis protein [Terracidiphilus sp.]
MKPFDATGAFAPSVPGGGTALRSLAVRGAGMNVFSGIMSLAIQVAATVVLGRILAPRDFGLVAMVLTFAMLLANAPNNGFIDAILQRSDITESLANNLFWISIAIALALTGGFVLAAPLIARFYDEQTVTRITWALSGQILLTVGPTVHAALLRRAMRFPMLAMNDIIARAAGVVTSIVLGMAGWGYWALVAGQLAMSLSTAIGVWILCPWMPGRPTAAQTRDTLNFARHISVRYSINYFVRNFDNLLVGWRFGANPLGFYKKAYDLFALSMTQLVSANANVAVSALSRVREDRAQWTRYLLGAMGMLAFVGMGIAGDFTLVGKDIIRVLLGPNWGTAGWIFTFFAPAIGIMMVYGVHGWIHVSLGHADRWLKWGVVEWVVTCAMFLAGLPWGPQGVAVAWSVSFWVLTLPGIWYAGRPIGFGVMPVIRSIWRYTVASIVASAATYALLIHNQWVRAWEGTGGAALRITCVTVLFVLLYILAVLILHRGPAPLRTMMSLMGELRGHRRATPVAAHSTEEAHAVPSVE